MFSSSSFPFIFAVLTSLPFPSSLLPSSYPIPLPFSSVSPFSALFQNAIGLAAIENVDDSVFARGLAEVERITESELVNGTSWIFCEQKWESHIQDLIQNKNMNISKCLNVSEILTMNYFVDGVVQKGFVSIPKSNPSSASLLLLPSLSLLLYRRSSSGLFLFSFFFCPASLFFSQ